MNCILEKRGDDYYLFSDKDAVIGDKCLDARSGKLIIASCKQPSKKILVSTNKEVDSFVDISEIEKLIGIVDVNKLAENFVSKDGSFKQTAENQVTWGFTLRGFISGYNKAVEDNSDKKYTLEDMKKAVEFGKQEYAYDNSNEMFPCPPKFTFESLIEQKTTIWEVEVESNVCGFNYTNLNIPTPVEYKITYKNKTITVIAN